MHDLETTVASIEGKIELLIAENKRLKTTVEEQAKMCQELQEAINKQNIIINNLENQNNITNSGNTLKNPSDNNEIKLKINQLIQTIDKSISLLTPNE